MVTKQQKPRPLFWLCLGLTTVGFLCNYIAFVLPYWYAKFPRSQNRFERLGLWEVCFDGYMPESIGNLMYNDCFYLYDKTLISLWSNIFRSKLDCYFLIYISYTLFVFLAWFVVCQAFYTISFILYILSEVMLITQAFDLISSRGPRAVLFLMIIHSATCLCILICLITMGAGVDDARRRQSRVYETWLQNLDQCTLSWSYGLAALSFPSAFLTLCILGWFVYPKRSSSGLLSVNAWNWPTADDWLCRHHINDLRTVSNRMQSDRSRSVYSAEAHTHSAMSGDFLAPRQPTGTSSQNMILPSQRNGPGWIDPRRAPPYIPVSPQRTEAASSINGKLSSYDPRSPDTVSLLSYDPLPPDRSTGHLPDASNRSRGTRASNRPVLSKSNRITSTALAARLEQMEPEFPSDTPVRRLHSADPLNSTTNTSIQAARPMRKSRDLRKQLAGNSPDKNSSLTSLTWGQTEQSPQRSSEQSKATVQDQEKIMWPELEHPVEE